MEKGSQNIAVITQNLKDARAQKLKTNSYLDKEEVKRDENEDEASEIAKILTKRKNRRHALHEARKT